jgi:transposase
MHPKSAPRRQHDAQIKAKVLAACNEPGASIAAVALAHGLNANLVRKWRHGRGLKRAGIATLSSVGASTPAMAPTSAIAAPLLSADARFLPIEMSAPAHAPSTGSPARGDTAAPVERTIDIELRRGPASLGVRWPVSAGGDCAAWLREVAAGLVK